MGGRRKRTRIDGQFCTSTQKMPPRSSLKRPRPDLEGPSECGIPRHGRIFRHIALA